MTLKQILVAHQLQLFFFFFVFCFFLIDELDPLIVTYCFWLTIYEQNQSSATHMVP